MIPQMHGALKYRFNTLVQRAGRLAVIIQKFVNKSKMLFDREEG